MHVNSFYLASALAVVASASVLQPRQSISEPAPPSISPLPIEVGDEAEPGDVIDVPSKPVVGEPTVPGDGTGEEPEDVVEKPECTVLYRVQPGDTCLGISRNAHVYVEDIPLFNNEDVCDGLWPGQEICIGIKGQEPDPTKPQPILPKTRRDCDEYYFVTYEDYCLAILEKFFLPLEILHEWNPSVGDTCSDLSYDYYICVSADGYVPDKSRPIPSSIGAIEGCDEWHKVVEEETCYSISQEYGISLDEFFDWNTNFDAGCENLMFGYYVCVGA